MRVPALRWTLLLTAVALVVGGPAAFGALRDNFASPPPPLPAHGSIAHLTMTGAVSGPFTGPGPNGTIQVLGLSFTLNEALDPHSHLPVGKTMCEGLDFRKPTDATTPSLFNSLSTHEVISRAIFRENNGLTITLTRAVLASVHHVASGTTSGFEDVTLIPREIEFLWTANGRTAVHQCHPD